MYPGSYLGQLILENEWMPKKWKRPNKDIKLTGKDSICSKQLKLKENKRIKSTYRYPK